MPLDLIDWSAEQSDRFRLYSAGGFTRAEARFFVGVLREVSPYRTGRLRDSWYKRRNQVLSNAPHARIQNTGGTIRAKTKDLFVPLKEGITSTTGGLVTVQGDGGPYVFDRRSRELVAVRRRSVTLRGHRYLDKAVDRQIREGEARGKAELEQLGNVLSPMPPSTNERD